MSLIYERGTDPHLKPRRDNVSTAIAIGMATIICGFLGVLVALKVWS